MGSKKCEVCKEAQSKYKCPSCLVPYCSLACFKKHKEIPCKRSAPPVEELPVIVLPKRSQEVDDPSCVLNNKQLQSIADSSEIRSFLEDVNLQKLIRKIDRLTAAKTQKMSWIKPWKVRRFANLQKSSCLLLIHKNRQLKRLALDVHLEVRPEAAW